jgi:hypothetical protein
MPTAAHRVLAALAVLTITTSFLPTLALADDTSVAEHIASTETLDAYAIDHDDGTTSLTLAEPIATADGLTLWLDPGTTADAQAMGLPPLEIRPESAGDAGVYEVIITELSPVTLRMTVTLNSGASSTVEVDDITGDPQGILPTLALSLLAPDIDVVLDQIAQSELGSSNHPALDELEAVLRAAEL